MKLIICFLVTFLLITLVSVSLIQADGELPTDCYREHLVDLSNCSRMPWDIPLPLFLPGYFGTLGTFVPGLPADHLHVATYGTHLVGNATYMRSGLMPSILLEKATAWGLDPNLYSGGIALDSCGYMGAAAWIRINGSGQEWIGPLLVVDCAAFVHKYERACLMHTVAELGYETFSLFQERGRLNNLELMLVSASQPLRPSLISATAPINYADSWLTESGLAC